MIHIPKIAKEYLPLRILGVCLLGYLGYYAVRWMLTRCHKTGIIDHVAQKSMHDTLFNAPQPVHTRVADQEISPDKITAGQGEYIVFRKPADDERKELTRETFEKVYDILTRYAPAAIVNRGSEKAAEDCANRYELIRTRVKEIDPDLEVVFVPRTLYELLFIRKCIREDVKHKEICPLLNPTWHQIRREECKDQQQYDDLLEHSRIKQRERKCWHLCYFTDAGDNGHAGVRDVAFRLNQAAVKTLAPTGEGFTYQEYAAFAEKEIAFLMAHHKRGAEEMERIRRGEKIDSIISGNTPGPTTNFGYEKTHGSIKPMGIRNGTDAQIIRDAVALDCSAIAQKSFILYRGADLEKDSPYCWSDKSRPYSLSFGTSLFAGCLYDGGATAFRYMRNGKNAYAVTVPFDQLHDSPFYIPPTNTVAQLFGDGEVFHARTKAWKDFNPGNIEGMNLGANGLQRDHLVSPLTKEELTAQFDRYKSKAVVIR